MLLLQRPHSQHTLYSTTTGKIDFEERRRRTAMKKMLKQRERETDPAFALNCGYFHICFPPVYSLYVCTLYIRIHATHTIVLHTIGFYTIQTLLYAEGLLELLELQRLRIYGHIHICIALRLNQIVKVLLDRPQKWMQKLQDACMHDVATKLDRRNMPLYTLVMVMQIVHSIRYMNMTNLQVNSMHIHM